MSNNNDLYSNQWQTIDPEQTIQQAITLLAQDASAVLEPTTIEAFKILYKDNPASYNRYRLLIKDSKKVTMSLFDKLTTKTLENQPTEQPPVFNLIAPIQIWDKPINGELLLNEIKETIQHYIIADDQTIIATTLWVVYTWFIDVVNYAPIANITAPEKRCGKTKLLSVLKRLSYKAFTTSNISAAALFRLIELYNPTLLIDEVDSFLNTHEDMRGIINSGFTRESAFIVRCVGEDLQPTPFNVWGAKALCGIGKIADTLQDRSIPLKLRRKQKGETIHNVDRSPPEQWATLRAKLARFAQDNQQQVLLASIDPIPQLHDRANDCWLPLLQVALVAGGHWLTTAIKTAIIINGLEEEPESSRTELLRDIKTILDTKRIDRIFSHELVNALNEDNEANWCIWNKGRGITARNLAKILKEFEIVSKSIRIEFNNAKGYTKNQFSDAFNRYLAEKPINSDFADVTTSQPKVHNESSDIFKRHNDDLLRSLNKSKNYQHRGCDVVTDKTPFIAGGGSEIVKNTPKTTHSVNDLLDNDEGVKIDC